MNVTVIGAGNSGIAMAAHLSKEGNKVTLWNRSSSTISKLLETRLIHCKGVISGEIPIHAVTNDIRVALEDPDIILITTPANSHRDLAELVGKNIRKQSVIILNPGRTFGALEFKSIYKQYNSEYDQIVAETQTIIYTCRKTAPDTVNILALKDAVLISSLDTDNIIDYLPECIRGFFKPAKSMIQTSIGNVGMVLHCAPLLLNAGWTESTKSIYKYYYDGITPTISKFIENLDAERVAVSEALGCRVETTIEWFHRTYHIEGDSIYDCIQNNPSYETIDAPGSLNHRYILEDIPCGLVPLEAVGLKMGINMEYTSLVIDLASKLMGIDFRETGRNLEFLDNVSKEELKAVLGRSYE